MAKLLKLRRGTTSQHSSFTGAEGEVTIDTDKDVPVVHDGSTAGGHPVAAEDMANVSSASIAGRLGTDSIATSKIAAGALPTDVTVASANIVDGTIVAADLASNSVVEAKIAAGAVVAEKLASNSVETAKIASNAVTAAKIPNGSIVADKLASNSVTTAKISDDAVTAAKIADTAIGTAALADNAVTTAKITNGNVTTAKIADDAVTAAKLADDAVGTAALADNAVDTAAIVDDAVTAAKLANTSVTAGSYGSATAIPAITVDAQGRVTAASTNTVNTTTNLATTTATDSVTVTSSTGNNAQIGEATGSAAGVMSVAHHDKLDGIAAGATNVTNTNQLTNGAGFITSASFSDVAGGGTFSGDVTFNGGTGAVQVSGGGDIRFNSGNWTGDYAGKIQHHSNWLYIQGGSNGIIFRDDGGSDRWYIDSSGTLYPAGNGSLNLGGSSNRINNIYVSDAHFANNPDNTNSVDGTWGDWTLQEGEETIYMLNNRNGKKYKMNLTEVS